MISDFERAARLQKQVSAFGGARSPLDQQIVGHRLVVAGSQVFKIPSAWSFHEFLLFYGQSQLSDQWISGNADHPLVAHLVKGKAGIQPKGTSCVVPE
jgi:hypothetical protein